MTSKERRKIERIDKGTELMNKYSVKIAAGPFIAGSLLIILYNFWKEPPVILTGIGLLLLGCLIPMVWYLVLTLYALSCKSVRDELRPKDRKR